MKTNTTLTLSALLLPALLSAAFAAHAQSAPPTAPVEQPATSEQSVTTEQSAPAEQATPVARPKVSSNAWTIEFDRTAKSAGTIQFRVWPYEHDPITVSVDVAEGQTKNSLAIAFRDAFRKALGNDYRVNMAEGFVRIVATHGERRFALEAVESTVEGVDIDLGRD